MWSPGRGAQWTKRTISSSISPSPRRTTTSASHDISPIAYKVLGRIWAKQLMTHLRSFCEIVVHEFSKSGGGGHVNIHEGNKAQVFCFINQLLLLKSPDVRTRWKLKLEIRHEFELFLFRMNEFCRTMSPEHHLLISQSVLGRSWSTWCARYCWGLTGV